MNLAPRSGAKFIVLTGNACPTLFNRSAHSAGPFLVPRDSYICERLLSSWLLGDQLLSSTYLIEKAVPGGWKHVTSDILGDFGGAWGVSGTSRGPIGKPRGGSGPLGGCLGGFGGSRGALGVSRGALGTLWGCLGTPWEALGELSGLPLGRRWGPRGVPRAAPRRAWRVLGSHLRLLGGL